jgi:hypothetical protein
MTAVVEAMFWQGRLWRWGVVVPVTVLAFAGGIADVVTGSLFFWYMLAPSYFVIAISVWNSLGAKAGARRRAALSAAERNDEKDQAAPQSMAADACAGDDAIVAQVRPMTMLSIAGEAWQTFLRVLWTLTFTFMFMVLIWMAIAIATWARGYWYIYGPIFAGVAWLVWTVVRSGPADAAERASPAQKLVR